MRQPMTEVHEEEICQKCGDELFETAASDSFEDLHAAREEHLRTCRGPEYRGKLAPCPFCGSKDVDPEGGITGRCQCPDAAAHEIMQCETRFFPVCDDCGASAASVELWNRSAWPRSDADAIEPVIDLCEHPYYPCFYPFVAVNVHGHSVQAGLCVRVTWQETINRLLAKVPNNGPEPSQWDISVASSGVLLDAGGRVSEALPLLGRKSGLTLFPRPGVGA